MTLIRKHCQLQLIDFNSKGWTHCCCCFSSALIGSVCHSATHQGTEASVANAATVITVTAAAKVTDAAAADVTDLHET